VLTTYEQERRPGAEASIDMSIELGKVICVPDLAEAAARDEAMASAVTGEVSEVPGQPGLRGGLIDADAPMAGEQFPQADLGGRWFDDVHGAGWRLVTDRGAVGDLDVGVVDWFSGIGGVVVALGDGAPDLTGWFDDHGVRWALQRPDFHLFGTAVDADGASSSLSRLRDLLGSSTEVAPSR
jgi:hypothetical protein